MFGTFWLVFDIITDFIKANFWYIYCFSAGCTIGFQFLDMRRNRSKPSSEYLWYVLFGVIPYVNMVFVGGYVIIKILYLACHIGPIAEDALDKYRKKLYDKQNLPKKMMEKLNEQ